MPLCDCGHFLQRVRDWSPRVVAEWLAANNFWDFADTFIQREINGERLLGITSQQLEVR